MSKQLILASLLLGTLAGQIRAGADPSNLRIGLWMESRPSEDSSALRSWAVGLVDDLDRRLHASGLSMRARMTAFHLVPRGTLPLSGGDAHHHPDLRDTTLDLVWGVQTQDMLSTAAPAAMRTWLGNLGCLDERSFLIGWDLFQLPQHKDNHLAADDFPPDGGVVRRPAWNLVPDSGLSLACRSAITKTKMGRGPLYSDSKRFTDHIARALSRPIFVESQDASGLPAMQSTFELWRGHPNPIRPYGSSFEGPPDTLVADSTGRIRFQDAKTMLCGDLPWTHGKSGSCGTAFWRLRHAHRSLTGWLDAGSILELAERQDTLVLMLQLPGGSSRSWKDATSHWPQPWLAAEADSTGTLTLGISVPTRVEYVLRVLAEGGQEVARTRPMAFDPGVYEKRIEKLRIRPGWDVRLDASSSRLQTRITTP